jgi:hypothetical protein
MRIASKDASFRGLTLDGVDLSDDVERILRLGMFALLEDLSASMREASRADALAGFGDRVVPGVLIDNESPRRIEHSLRRLAAAIGATGQGASLGVTIRSTVKPEPCVSFHRWGKSSTSLDLGWS